MDRRGVLADRAVQLAGRGAGFVSGVYKNPAEDGQAALVVIVLPRLQQELVRDAGGVGQLLHSLGVSGRHAGRRRQGERRTAARGHHGRLTAEKTCDLLPRTQQQLLHLDIMAVCRGHRLLHGG